MKFNGIEEDSSGKKRLYWDACGCCQWSTMISETDINDLISARNESDEWTKIIDNEIKKRENK